MVGDRYLHATDQREGQVLSCVTGLDCDFDGLNRTQNSLAVRATTRSAPR